MMGHYFLFFQHLPDLLRAYNWKAPFLGSQDHFDVSYDYPFILLKTIKCEKRLINASKDNPRFCTQIVYLINPHLRNEPKYVKRSITKVEKILHNFRTQSFYKNVNMCKGGKIHNKYFRNDSPANLMQDAKYFPGLISMVHYCKDHNIISLEKMNDNDGKLIKEWLKMEEDISWESLNEIQEI